MPNFDPDVTKYYPGIKCYLTRKTQSHDAEDLLQEVFIQAHREFHKYNPNRGGIYSWLCNIARSRLGDHWRKVKSRQEVQLSDQERYSIDTENPDTILILYEALNNVPEILTTKPTTPKERMKRVRAQRKYIEEFVL